LGNEAGKIGVIRLQINRIVLKDRVFISRHGLNGKFIVLLPPNPQDTD
jgi:hypothetical protein